MKALMELAPVAIGVAFLAGLTWFLLNRGIGLGPWLLAGLLLFHGWVHVLFMFPAPEAAAASGSLAYPFDMSRSWLIGGVGIEPGVVRIIGIALIAVTVAGFALAALATVGWLVPAGWWAGLVLASAATSMLLLVVFFSPALVLGLAIDAALWILVLASIWSPSSGASLGRV